MKPVTHKQYEDAIKTILVYRAQVIEESKKICAEVKEINPTGKRTWIKPLDFSGCTKDTLLKAAPLTVRLFNILYSSRSMKSKIAYAQNERNIYHNIKKIDDMPLICLGMLSESEISMERNFGEKCMVELKALCKHIGVEMQP